MPITNVTDYTMDILYGFNKHTARKRIIVSCVVFGIATMIALLFLATYLFALFSPSLEPLPFSFVLYFIIILLFDIYFILSHTVLLKLAIKRTASFNSHAEYTFGEDEMVETSTGKNINASTTIKYEQVCKVTENDRCIFVFFGINQAMLIDKSGFTNGTAEQLRGLLRSKVDAKKLKLK